MTRRAKIVFLLEHLNDCLGPSSSATREGAGDGPGFVLTSSMADHPSVVEIGRCLDVLSRAAPKHADHLQAYFCCNWYVQRIPKTAKRHGRIVRVMNRDGTPAYDFRRVRGLPAWLACVPLDRETGEPRTVARGVDFISGLFTGEPFIPDQLDPEKTLRNVA